MMPNNMLSDEDLLKMSEMPDAGPVAPQGIPAALQFDPEKFLQDQKDYQRKASLRELQGSAADSLGGSNSLGNYMLGAMRHSDEGAKSAARLNSMDMSPAQRQAALYQNYQNAMQAKKAKETEDEMAQSKDPNSSRSIMFNAYAAKNGIKLPPGMSEYDAKQLFDFQKYNTEKARGEVDFKNDIEKMKLQHQLGQSDFKNRLTLENELKGPNGDQLKAAGFAQRVSDAEKTLQDLSGKGYTGAGIGSSIQGSDYFPNMFKSSEQQSLEQAQRNMVNAILRRESGAAISNSEFDSARKQYFPQAGDSPEVVEQKRQNRQAALASLSAESGNAGNRVKASLANIRGQAPAGKEPQVGAQSAKAFDATVKKMSREEKIKYLRER